MKSYPTYVLVFLGIFLLLAACSKKQESPPSKEGYVGNWKLTDSQGGTYYMTLNPDGSGKTTREGGEFGKWEFKQDHIEAEWIPKNFKIYFNPGQARPLLKNPSVKEGVEPSVGTKVDTIPQ
jgi:hypothetical protein